MIRKNFCYVICEQKNIKRIFPRCYHLHENQFKLKTHQQITLLIVNQLRSRPTIPPEAELMKLCATDTFIRFLICN
jgi:hypothetical protein